MAMELLLNTALRVTDAVKAGRGHVRNGAIHITAQKTGAALVIPINTELAAAINAAALSEHMVFLTDERGHPFTAERFTKWFGQQCRAAGLKGLSAHGLRKAACRRMAEAGATASEIASISGHASLKEVARYTKAADQAKLARSAMAKIGKARLMTEERKRPGRPRQFPESEDHGTLHARDDCQVEAVCGHQSA